MAPQPESTFPNPRQYLTMLGDIALAGEVPLDDLLQRSVEVARSLPQACSASSTRGADRLGRLIADLLEIVQAHRGRI